MTDREFPRECETDIYIYIYIYIYIDSIAIFRGYILDICGAIIATTDCYYLDDIYLGYVYIYICVHIYIYIFILHAKLHVNNYYITKMVIISLFT